VKCKGATARGLGGQCGLGSARQSLWKSRYLDLVLRAHGVEARPFQVYERPLGSWVRLTWGCVRSARGSSFLAHRELFGPPEVDTLLLSLPADKTWVRAASGEGKMAFSFCDSERSLRRQYCSRVLIVKRRELDRGKGLKRKENKKVGWAGFRTVS